MSGAKEVLARAELTIDLGSVVANYRTILAKLSGVNAAAMLKAGAYGLGVSPVATALWADGCRQFFVAQLEEGIALRADLPEASISVLNGPLPSTARDMHQHGLVPVLNSLPQVEAWQGLAREVGRSLPAAVHFDTGMNRLGLDATEAETVLENPSVLDGVDVIHVMSHLASAEEVDSDGPERQLERFRRIRARLSAGTASLANSAGIFRGQDFHFDLGRPGIALFGGSPVVVEPGLMRTVATLRVPILQVRDVGPDDEVGYGATHTVGRPARLATIAVGYADGYLRSGSNSGSVAIAGRRVPIVGRISMDLTTVDVTEIGADSLYPGAPVELLGESCLLDDVAVAAGTISYELLTNLGNRYKRTYVAP